MKIKLKTSLLLIFFRLFSPSSIRAPSIDVYRTSNKYTHEYILAGTNELHNYSLENRFFSFSHSHPLRPLNAFASIKMLLFIANVSVKRVLSYAGWCPKQFDVFGWRGIDCPLDTHRFIDFLTNAPSSRNKSASKTHLNFVSLCKSSLLIGAHFSSPPDSPDFFISSTFPPYAFVVFVRDASECSRLYTLEKESEKTFGKLIAGKKRNDIAKKSVQPPRWRNERKKSFYPVYERWIHKHF